MNFNKEYDFTNEVWKDKDTTAEDKITLLKAKLEEKKISYRETNKGIFIQEKDVTEANK